MDHGTLGHGRPSLQECLRLQLAAQHQENTLAMRIVTEAWELFEKLKLPEISRQCGVDVREIQAAIDEIKTLHPKPGFAGHRRNSVYHRARPHRGKG